MRFARLTVATFSALAAGLSAQTTRLELGKTIPGDLSGGQTHAYSVTLAAGQYIHAEFKTLGADLIVGLYAPDEAQRLEVNTVDFPAKTAPVYFVADSAGDYRLEVKVQGQRAGSAHYEISTEQRLKPRAS